MYNNVTPVPLQGGFLRCWLRLAGRQNALDARQPSVAGRMARTTHLHTPHTHHHYRTARTIHTPHAHRCRAHVTYAYWRKTCLSVWTCACLYSRHLLLPPGHPCRLLCCGPFRPGDNAADAARLSLPLILSGDDIPSVEVERDDIDAGVA